MFRYLRRHRKLLMVSMALCIGGLLVFGIGSPSFVASPQDVIVRVNGEKIRQGQFDRVLNQMSRQAGEISPEAAKRLTLQARDEVIRQEVFHQEAEKYGIRVTDQELQMNLSAIPAFQREGRFDAQAYLRFVGQMFGGSIDDFEKSFRKDLEGQKVNRLIATTAHVSDAVLQKELETRLKTEKDAKKRKEWQANPELLRQELRGRETNLIFNDWLQGLNSTLKVNIVSDRFRQRLQAASQ